MRTFLIWLGVIAVFAVIISDPQGAADFIGYFVGGIVDFFKALIGEVQELFR